MASDAALMVERDGARRRRLAELGKRVAEAESAGNFSSWSDIDGDIALRVAEAVMMIGGLREQTSAPLEHPEEVEEDWDGYFRRLRNTFAATDSLLMAAVRACDRRLTKILT